MSSCECVLRYAVRSAPPPDFRYVGLEPSRPALLPKVMLGGASVGTGAALLLAGADASAAVLASALAASGCWLAAGKRRRSSGAGEVPFAVVPWGVLAYPAEGLRVLRWSAVRQVRVDVVFAKDSATPITRFSRVTIQTDRELYTGRAPGLVSLERLEAHLDRYTHEAAREASSDLDGQELLDHAYEPNVERLLLCARSFLRSKQAGERLGVTVTSYRSNLGSAVDRVRAEQALAEVLDSSLSLPLDPRPLALVLCAELELTGSLGRVCALTTSPHPLVAALARAAALRLGAEPKRVGAIEELAEFLPVEDVERLREWAARAAG